MKINRRNLLVAGTSLGAGKERGGLVLGSGGAYAVLHISKGRLWIKNICWKI